MAVEMAATVYERIKEVCDNIRENKTITGELIEILAEKNVYIDPKYILAVECSYYEHRDLKTATIDIYMPGLTVKVMYDSDRESEDYRVIVMKDQFECICH